ncbi:hypothetical protein C5167_018054 [Papaver somniferum]|uniref:Uncharacterized protein n=1 Tax=Papaver somniferum TaxID=3469 RepID=A0A4Y7IQ86_PAPSO|nr:hypothetical protein C5167_018054 [Papaver somniferum]
MIEIGSIRDQRERERGRERDRELESEFKGVRCTKYRLASTVFQLQQRPKIQTCQQYLTLTGDQKNKSAFRRRDKRNH